MDLEGGRADGGAQRVGGRPGQGGQNWPILVVNRLRERGIAEEARPRLEEGHLIMNWDVTGTRYLCRRREIKRERERQREREMER